MANLQSKEDYVPNPWNPFKPTERDIKRTKKLANKNPLLAGILTFFFVPLAMVYLNRGVNSLKIGFYTILIAISVGSRVSNSESVSSKINEGFSFIGNIVMVAENINAIGRARKRQQNS